MSSRLYDIVRLSQERKHWKNVNTECLKNKSKCVFLIRKNIVDMYIDGYSIKEIIDMTGTNRSTPIKYIEKCCKTDEYGCAYGYTALIPYKHLKNYTRKLGSEEYKGNYSGSLNQLFNTYPSLKEYVDNLYLMKDKTILEKNIIPKIVFYKFLSKCREIGIKEYEYPFNTKNLGERSIYRYLQELSKKESNYAIQRNNKNAMQNISQQELDYLQISHQKDHLVKSK